MQKMNTYMTFDGLANSRIDTFVRFQRTFGQQASRCAKASVVCMGLALAANASAQVANPALVQLHFPDLAKAQFLILPQIEQASSESLASPLTLQAGTPLQELIRRGLATNPQLKQVQAQQESAQAQRKAARADLLPSFTARSAMGPEQSQTVGSAQNKHTYNMNSLRMTQPVYNRVLLSEFAATQQAESAADLRLRSAHENTVMSVVRATADLAAAKLVLEFSDVQLAQLQSIMTYLENRAAAGASSQADLERARTRVYGARQTRLEQQAAYRNAMVELQRLTGSQPEAIELPSIRQFPVFKVDRKELNESALAQNADIRALQRDVDVQQLRVKAELARYQPVVGLSLEHDSSKNIQGTNNRHTDTRALVVINWATSLGGKEWFQAQVASAELRQREARLTDEKQRLSQALDADLALLESAQLRIGAAQLEQASASRVVEAVDEQLRTGRLGSLLEALDASERYFGARQRLTLAVGQTLKAHAQILQRIGQLNDEAVMELNPVSDTSKPKQPS
jgi:outer membrane protein TolC